MTGIQQYFDLKQNSLTGPIPTEFGNLAALNSYFRLQHNCKSGEPARLLASPTDQAD